MRQLTTAIHRLLCCGYVMLGIIACAPTPPMPSATQTLESARKPNLPQLSAGKFALAIFPWSISGGHLDVGAAEPEGLRALEKAASETNFILTHSFYTLEDVQLQRLTRKAVPKLRRVWQGKNPNIDTIIRLGAELGVKAVFIYDMDIGWGTDVLRAYLVDIASQKSYEAKSKTWEFGAESYYALLGLAREVFTAYARDQV